MNFTDPLLLQAPIRIQVIRIRGGKPAGPAELEAQLIQLQEFLLELVLPLARRHQALHFFFLFPQLVQTFLDLFFGGSER